MLNNNTRNKIMQKFNTLSKKKSRDYVQKDTSDAGFHNELLTSTDSPDEFISITHDNHIINDEEKIIFRGEKTLQEISTKKIITAGDICIYSIKNINNQPFLTYILQNKKDVLQWLSVNDYKAQTIETLHITLQKELSGKLKFKGMNIKQQLWFELIDSNVTIKQVNRNQQYITCLVSEIVNVKYYLNIPIAKDITDFFLDFPEYIYLYNKQNLPYDIPEVGYYGNYYKKIALIAALGVKRETPKASMGSYYYFAGYKRALRYALRTSMRRPMEINGNRITIDELGTYTKGGLVRFALFLGKTTSLLGRTTDKDDSAKISQHLAKTEEFYKLTLKNRDSDGNWTKYYDSIVMGKTFIVNCKTCKQKNSVLDPQIIVKTFEQQIPLTYYYVNTSQKIDEDNLFSVNVI